MAFGDAEGIQPHSGSDRQSPQGSKNYTLKIHQSVPRSKLSRKVKDDNQYKCYNCFGQPRNCRVCGGKKYIPKEHPMV